MTRSAGPRGVRPCAGTSGPRAPLGKPRVLDLVRPASTEVLGGQGGYSMSTVLRMFWLLGLLMIPVLAGVACHSPIPIDPEPQVEIDVQLVGTWRCVHGEPDDEDAAGRVTFAAAGDREYEVTTRAEDGLERYQAYPSVVGDSTLLNIREVDDDSSEPWMFFGYVKTASESE